MIFIAAALSCEALPLIERFQLKRDTGETKFRIYRSDAIRLIITGVGGSAAMIAITYLLSVNRAQRTDWLINAGIAAAFEESADTAAGGIYRCRAIRNMALRRSFYPDILYSMSLAEAEILTVPYVYSKGADDDMRDKWRLPFIGTAYRGSSRTGVEAAPLLIDMEAAYVYEAGCEFIFSHHIFILKIISDAGDADSINQTIVKKLVAGQIGHIAELVRMLYAEESEAAACSLRNDEFESLASHASEALMLSCYQDTELRRIAYNYNIRRNDLAAIIGMDSIDCIKDEIGIDKISSRKEGRSVYETIRSRLLES
ncbi:MAG: hypothetical protein ACYCYM_06020 [Saccharofermentanales bacterium]